MGYIFNTTWNTTLTSSYAIKRLWSKIVDFLSLIGRRTVAVYLVYGCVGVVNPVHQPLQLAIAGEQISTQITGEHRKVSSFITSLSNNLLVHNKAGGSVNTYTFVKVSTPLKRSFGRVSRLLKARLLQGNYLVKLGACLHTHSSVSDYFVNAFDIKVNQPEC